MPLSIYRMRREVQMSSTKSGISTMFIFFFFVIMMMSGIAFLASYKSNLGTQQIYNAEDNATNWAHKMYPGKDATISCIRRDSDNNYYVSCSVFVDGNIIALECTYNDDSGCKIAQPILRTE